MRNNVHGEGIALSEEPLENAPVMKLDFTSVIASDSTISGPASNESAELSSLDCHVPSGVTPESPQMKDYRGVSYIDPIAVEEDCQGPSKQRLEADLEELARNWGVNIVRIPLTPTNWFSSSRDWKVVYEEKLNRILEKARLLNIAVIIDWHGYGDLEVQNLKKSVCQTPQEACLGVEDPGLCTAWGNRPTLDQTKLFWEQMSHFVTSRRNNPTIFYEILNEPTDEYTEFGACSFCASDEERDSCLWSNWRDKAEEIIDLIRTNEPERTVLVGGVNWGYDLSGALTEPVRRPNVVYVTHPYPGKKREKSFRAAFEDVAKCVNKKSDSEECADIRQYGSAVFATEWGFDPEPPKSCKAPCPYHGDAGNYGVSLLQTFQELDIGWTAWSFSVDWIPALLSSRVSMTKSDSYGAFVFCVLTTPDMDGDGVGDRCLGRLRSRGG